MLLSYELSRRWRHQGIEARLPRSRQPNGTCSLLRWCCVLGRNMRYTLSGKLTEASLRRPVQLTQAPSAPASSGAPQLSRAAAGSQADNIGCVHFRHDRWLALAPIKMGIAALYAPPRDGARVVVHAATAPLASPDAAGASAGTRVLIQRDVIFRGAGHAWDACAAVHAGPRPRGCCACCSCMALATCWTAQVQSSAACLAARQLQLQPGLAKQLVEPVQQWQCAPGCSGG